MRKPRSSPPRRPSSAHGKRRRKPLPPAASPARPPSASHVVAAVSAGTVDAIARDLAERVLYRDEAVLVIDKPAGLPVHTGPGGGPALEDALDALKFGRRERPGLAHRLDRDTSGCLALGRRRSALRRLGALFAAGRVEKTYWAVAIGMPPAESGRIELALRKQVRKEGWRMVPDMAGQAAITDWRLLGRGPGIAWLELKPRTGRTHQVRVHCAALGCPVLGDPIYGAAKADIAPGPVLHLHARAIRLPCTEDGPPIAIEAPVPTHMLKALRSCGFAGD